MKFIQYLLYFFSLTIILIFYSCGTSTGSRYSQEEKQPEKAKKEQSPVKKYPEDFNLSGYHAEFHVPPSNKKKNSDSLDIWYGYHNTSSNLDTTQMPVKTMPGYRVQVLITDNLDEAKNMRSDIYFKSNQKAVYIVFDPPFYKVEVGDFKNMADAKSLSFQLKQLGFSDARVINETINIF